MEKGDLKRLLKSKNNTGNCRKCGKEVVCDQPYIEDGVVYLKSLDHGCGFQYTHTLGVIEIKALEGEGDDD